MNEIKTGNKTKELEWITDIVKLLWIALLIYAMLVAWPQSGFIYQTDEVKIPLGAEKLDSYQNIVGGLGEGIVYGMATTNYNAFLDKASQGAFAKVWFILCSENCESGGYVQLYGLEEEKGSMSSTWTLYHSTTKANSKFWYGVLDNPRITPTAVSFEESVYVAIFLWYVALVALLIVTVWYGWWKPAFKDSR